MWVAQGLYRSCGGLSKDPHTEQKLTLIHVIYVTQHKNY